MAMLYTGTSGFAYPSWKPGFYPEKLAQRRFLEYYAERLNAVEVNYTFRRLPSRNTLEKWVEATPDRFLFAVKAHQRITHFARLEDVEEFTGVFLDALEPLRTAGKLGPLLFQLPPSFRRSDEHIERLAGFLAMLGGRTRRGAVGGARPERSAPAGTEADDATFGPGDKAATGPPAYRAAVEFRDGSWFAEDVFALLHEHGVALCVTDSETLDVPDVVTAGFVYYRLRRPEYSDADVDRWGERAGEHLVAGRDACVMLKHEDDPGGALAAERLLAKVPD